MVGLFFNAFLKHHLTVVFKLFSFKNRYHPWQILFKQTVSGRPKQTKRAELFVSVLEYCKMVKTLLKRWETVKVASHP